MDNPTVANRSDWLIARKRLLAKEKALTRQRDQLNAERRGLPLVKLEKHYVFENASGKKTLPELFDGQKQLIVYHFMFDPQWDEGCKSCSFYADSIPSSLAHFAARNTTFVVVSRAPIAKIEAFKARMGWTFPWYSAQNSDFNYDFHVTLDEAAGSVEYNYESAAVLKASGKLWMDELPGLSVFLREGAHVFHSYSTFQRGLDALMGHYNYLDLTPLGRQEEGLPWSMAWLQYHDRYVPAGAGSN